MASSDRELEEQLLEAGNKLVDPPSSLDELLPLLDRVESCLSKVEQSPSKSMQNALDPSLKALVADKLFKHSDPDVKVAVASCISEITRITAPDAPFDDDQMREIFQLIVSSFEDLSDNSSRSYTKRTSILETVAKVRSCVVMLDLECDALILEMFQHFLKAIRDYHPENVFSSMETIVTLVLEESEDIPPEMISPILDSIKKDNKEVLPIAQKLGERVLERCAEKVKPYLLQAVKTLCISLDDYSEVLSTICKGNFGSEEPNGGSLAEESKSAGASLEQPTQAVDKEVGTETPCPKQVNPVSEKSPNSIASNGTVQVGEGESLADANCVKKLEENEGSDQTKVLDTAANDGSDNLNTEKAENHDEKTEHTPEKREQKSNSTVKSAEPSEGPSDVKDQETKIIAESDIDSKDVHCSVNEDPSDGMGGPSKNDKANEAKPSSPKVVGDESENVPSPSPSGSVHNEIRSKKSGRVKIAKGVVQPSDDGSKKVSEGTSDSEVKPSRRSAKKVPLSVSEKTKTATVDESTKKGGGNTSNSEAKKQSSRKIDEGTKSGDEPSSKKPKFNKRRASVKSGSEKVATKSSTKDEDKEMASSPKSAPKSNKDEHHMESTSKKNLKRKLTTGKDKEPKIKECGENLVGLKIKVYWPLDRTFYEGVIDSFDSVRKKHKVLYIDGDEELLNLKKQRWEIIKDDAGSDEGEESDHASPDTSIDMPLKKKGKTNASESNKQGKVDASPKSGGAAASIKSKGVSAKSGSKSEDGGKIDVRSKDSKAVKKSEDDSGKAKEHAPRSSGKSVETAQKITKKSKSPDTPKTSKSKDEDGAHKSSAKSKQETPKTGKSKQETSNTTFISKGKPAKSSGKSNSNGSGKVKSGSSKAKEKEVPNKNSTDSTKAQENTKGKSPNPSKAQGSEPKTGKKRGRA